MLAWKPRLKQKSYSVSGVTIKSAVGLNLTLHVSHCLNLFESQLNIMSSEVTELPVSHHTQALPPPPPFCFMGDEHVVKLAKWKLVCFTL